MCKIFINGNKRAVTQTGIFVRTHKAWVQGVLQKDGSSFYPTVADFSAAEKDRSVNFACVLDCYPDRSSPVMEVKGQKSRSPGQKTRLALPTPTRVRANGMRSLQAAYSSSVQQRLTRAFPGGRGVTSVAACTEAR